MEKAGKENIRNTGKIQGLLKKVGGLVFPLVRDSLPTLLEGYLEQLRESEKSMGALREVVMAVFDNLVPRKHAVEAAKRGETIKDYIDRKWKPPEDEEEREKVKKEHPERVKYWRMRQVIYAFIGVAKKIVKNYDYHPSVEKAIRKCRPYFRETDLGVMLDYRIGREWYRKQMEEVVHWIWPDAPAMEAEKEEKNGGEGNGGPRE